MNTVKFKDIEGNDLVVNPDKVEVVRNRTHIIDEQGTVEYTTLVYISGLSIPVSETYENACKLLGFSVE
jgi:hypothetical protein